MRVEWGFQIAKVNYRWACCCFLFQLLTTFLYSSVDIVVFTSLLEVGWCICWKKLRVSGNQLSFGLSIQSCGRMNSKMPSAVGVVTAVLSADLSGSVAKGVLAAWPKCLTLLFDKYAF